MTGGPWVFRALDGYELWYHASTGGVLPTDIYHARSSDLMNWTVDSTGPALRRTEGWEVDQVADPSLVEAGGQTFLFYDGDDNPKASASIGAAVFDGTLSELLTSSTVVVHRDFGRIAWLSLGLMP